MKLALLLHEVETENETQNIKYLYEITFEIS